MRIAYLLCVWTLASIPLGVLAGQFIRRVNAPPTLRTKLIRAAVQRATWGEP